MTRREVHIIQVTHIPGTDNDPSGIRIMFDRFDSFADLVDRTTFIVRPRAPLETVDMSQVPVGVCPFIPDTHSMFLQIFCIGIPLKEPE